MNYQAEAAVTESPQFYGELLRMKQFESDLLGAIYALQRLDPIKKLLFYGKKEKAFRNPIGIDCNGMPALLKAKEGDEPINEQIAVRIIHGILGVATEACEMLELLSKSVTQNEDFDRINLMEESGDIFWYLACLSNATGISFEEVQRINIDKLRKRYPNKFTEFDAINRNVEAERTVLEQKPVIDADTKFQRIREVTAIQCSPGNFDVNEYMRGMANGLILAQAIVDDKEPKYIEKSEPPHNVGFEIDACADLED